MSRIKLARRIEEERRSRAENGAVRRDDAHYIIIAEEEVRVLRDYRPRIRIKLRKALVICFHGFDSFFKIRLVVHVEDGFFRPIFIF